MCSALLNETDLAFIRRVEWITSTKAEPGSQSELSVVDYDNDALLSYSIANNITLL